MKTYEVAKQLINCLEQESKFSNEGKVSYPWLTGAFEAVIKMMPDNEENISYLEGQIALCKDSIKPAKTG